MWYNDDDKEAKQAHWKNSEVMRIFAEQYLEPKLAAEEGPKARSVEEINKYLNAMNENADLYPGGEHGLLYQESRRIVEKELQEAMEREGTPENMLGGPWGLEDDCGDGAPMGMGGELPVAKVLVVKENLRSELTGVIEKLAGLSSQYGNEKVRYMMERAVDDLKAIQHYGE